MSTLTHDLDYFDVSVFDPPIESTRENSTKCDEESEENSDAEEENRDDNCDDNGTSFDPEQKEEEQEGDDQGLSEDEAKLSQGVTHEKESSVPSTTLWSEKELAKSDAADTWALPAGTIPWDENERPMTRLLNYADLRLTDQEENGLLTDRIVAACSSYLTESPENRCHVAAKVSLNNKNLSDIRILGYHRFLQYVDLSWNNLKDLTPLGCIPYLMYLDVSHNLLEDVLRFRPPLTLTYVNYSYNEVWQIDDLSEFWTVCYLDLSHNKISKIQGLHELRYLRHLDLSHNKIERFENLSNLRLTDLNLEYNLISKFEVETGLGMKTMPYLTNLYLNNNLISNLEFLQDVYHLKKLDLQGNNISDLVQLTHMKHLKNLRYLDLSGNSVSTQKPYRSLLLRFLAELKFLDQSEVNISERVAACTKTRFDAQLEAARNNARMILLEQLNDTTLGLSVLPVDQGPYPFVILVGPSASSKKYITSRLAEAHPEKIYLGKLHTTRKILEGEKELLIETTHEDFNEMIKAGRFLCVSENLGHLYGFSKDELSEAIKEHKLCLTSMDMVSALTVHSNCLQPFLILAILKSKEEHIKRLKMTYGPVISFIGAAYMSQRQLLNTHESNVKRVQVVLNYILSEVDKRICDGDYGTNEENDAEIKSVEKVADSEKSSVAAYFERAKQDYPCSPGLCGYQTCMGAVPEYGTSSVTSEGSQRIGSFEEVKKDTSTTSYSTHKNSLLKVEGSFDDEHTYGEDDVFADWSMPFIEWSQVNLSGLQLEEAAELLCEKYIESVMSTRDIYESLHLDNPGLFSLIVSTDVTENAVKSITKFLKEIWEKTPTRKPVFSMEDDLAYQAQIPRKLEQLKEILRDDFLSSGDGMTKGRSSTNSPAAICQEMRFKGYGDSFDDAK
ncbi:hypothetical protein RUM44_008994 [Polyplax serrata]|uniref:Guanylate kinase-like domain-containing protein n=1 Tax=Polyplax serrata TaxID=468196 RepID=A0ABR1ARG0_POLSC